MSCRAVCNVLFWDARNLYVLLDRDSMLYYVTYTLFCYEIPYIALYYCSALFCFMKSHYTDVKLIWDMLCDVGFVMSCCIVLSCLMLC